MIITKQYSWNRRDFSFNARCEHCGHIDKNLSGYDDANYYNNVMPDMKCSSCKESSNSKEAEDIKTKTKVIPRYDPGLII